MKEKEELIDEMQAAFPRIPQSTREVLSMIVDPKVIEHTKRYIESMDANSKCLMYEAPWSCAKEAEARYENIRYGWLAAGNGVGYSEWWCENCRRKIISGSSSDSEAREEELENEEAINELYLKDRNTKPEFPY